MSKAYSYVRFSSAEQAKGRSKARQQELCREYCAKYKLELATEEEYEFIDEGKSGFLGEHLGENGQLARFMTLVENNTIEPGSTLIVESLDRLSRRRVWEALPWFMKLVEKGIRVVTLADGRCYTEESTEHDLILAVFVMARAHEESKTKSDRVRDAMRKKHKDAREHKKPMGRMIPLWLEIGPDGAFRVRKDRAAVVKEIFELAATGTRGTGKAAIARTLNARGVENFKANEQRKKSKEPKGWGASSVDKVLKNRAVLGEYQPFSVQGSEEGKRVKAGGVIHGYYPPIIDKELFDAANGVLVKRRSGGSGTKQSKNINVWQGVAKCLHCGGSMHLIDKGKGPKGRTYIQCYQARKGLGCEKGKLVRLEHSEQVFRGMLVRLESESLVRDDDRAILKKLNAVEGRMEEQRTLLAEYRADYKRARSSALAEMMAEAEGTMEALEREQVELQALHASQKGTSMDFDEFMQRLDLESPTGRDKANSLLRRLGVLVHIGRDEGYAVSQQGRIAFGMDYRDGQAGFLGTYWHHKREGEELHASARRALAQMARLGEFIPATKAGIDVHAEQEDAAQEAYEALEDQGQPVGEY